MFLVLFMKVVFTSWVKRSYREPTTEPLVPEASILGSGSSRDDLGDEDGRIVSDVRIIGSSSDTEAQSRVPLTNKEVQVLIPSSGPGRALKVRISGWLGLLCVCRYMDGPTQGPDVLSEPDQNQSCLCMVPSGNHEDHHDIPLSQSVPAEIQI